MNRPDFEPADVVRAPDAERAEVDLTCDRCGAPLAWSPEDTALRCGHCDWTREVRIDEGTILERPLEEAAAAARGLGLDLRVVRCETCGARTALEAARTADRCPFCGSATVLDREALRNQIRPESLLPLDVGRDAVDDAFRRWVRRLWFRPNALRRARIGTAVGVYVPAWTFDCAVHSDWTAQSGTYYWVTETYTTMENGRPVTRTRQVRRVRWWPSWGDRDDAYDDLQVLASRGIDAALARDLGDFDTSELVPYRPAYLAGWRAEEYQVDLEAAWGLAETEIVATQRRRCTGDVPGDTHRALRVQNRIEDVRWKHVLLPLWSVTYAFRGKPYAVLVHGRTGRVVGRAPYSWVKIAALVLGLLAVALVVALVVSLTR